MRENRLVLKFRPIGPIPSLSSYLLFESDDSSFNKHQFRYGNNFLKNVAQLVFNCLLLPIPQNNLAGKRPIARKSLATLLMGRINHLTRVVSVVR